MGTVGLQSPVTHILVQKLNKINIKQCITIPYYRLIDLPMGQ